MSYITYQGKRVSFGGSHNLKLPDINTGLVGYWNLDEPSGLAAYDSKHICDGARSGSHTLITDPNGKIGNCKYFPETSNVIIVENYNTIQQLQGKVSFSVSLWFKINSYPTQVGTGSYGLYNVWGDTFPITIYVSNADDQLSTRFGTVDGYEYPNITFNPSVGVWYHYVAVLPQGDQPKFYVDGSLIYTYPLGLDASFAQGTGATYIGAAGPVSWDADHYIDEVGLWKRALTESEVQLLYNSGAGRTFPFVQNRQNLLTDIAAYWKLDETSGIDVYDSYVNGVTLTAMADASINSLGKIGKSIFFSSSQYLSNESGGCPIVINGNNEWSFSTWFYATTLPSIKGTASRFHTIRTNLGYFIGGIHTDDKLLLYITNSAGDVFDARGLTTIQLNAWNHAVLIANNGNLKIYLNGNDDTSGSPTYTGTLDIGKSDGLLQIGTSGDVYFAGKLDEVGIWNRALTSVDVSLLYNKGYGNSYPFIIDLFKAGFCG